MVTTFAGNGILGFADGKGTTAQFKRPHGIVIDDDGNLFVADTENDRVRKITPDGTVSTVTGSSSGFMDGPLNIAQFFRPKCITKDIKGNFYVSDESNQRIRKITKTPTGLYETHLSEIGVYPNPAREAINLKCTVEGISTRVFLYNFAGQVVIEQTISTADYKLNCRIDISGLESGHYWISINSGNMLESKMIFKY